MKKKNDRKTMDIVLIVIAAVLIIFTVTMVITFWHNGSVPDILITAVFGACLGEFGFMAWIKNVKERYGNEGYDADPDSMRCFDGPGDRSDQENVG